MTTPTTETARDDARTVLVRLHLPLVDHLASRFRGRGEPLDDLVQVGTIGLLKAIDRFRPDRGVEFATYATPTIVGEIKRHFRDKGWSIRVPRRVQELRQSLVTTTCDLTQKLGRSPTVAEIAVALDANEELVLEALESASAYAPLSLDAPDVRIAGGSTVGEGLGATDDALAHVEYRESLKPLLAALEPRERRVIVLRFFAQMTQTQIAGELGVSQMQVSRLLSRTLARLRSDLGGDY